MFITRIFPGLRRPITKNVPCINVLSTTLRKSPHTTNSKHKHGLLGPQIRCYATADARVQEPELTNTQMLSPIQLQRIEELLSKGSEMVAQEKFVSARPLLESALELAQKYQISTKLTAYIYINLSFTYHHLKLSNAEEYYLRAIDQLKSFSGPMARDLGVLQLNLAELLITQNRTKESIELVKSAIHIIRHHHKNDSFLAGALNNYAGYLTTAGNYQEARAPCQEALKIFCKELGRNNEHTRAAFANMYQILKKLGLDDEIGDLEADWDSIDKNEVKSVSDREVLDMTENFLHTVKLAEPLANPDGLTKGPKLYRQELNEFFGTWQDRGHDLADPAVVPVIEQEVNALKRGIEERERLGKKMKLRRTETIETRKRSPDEEIEYYAKLREQERQKSALKFMDKQHNHTEALAKEYSINLSDLDMTETEEIRQLEKTRKPGYEMHLTETVARLAEEAKKLEEQKSKRTQEKADKKKAREEQQKKEAAKAAEKDKGKKKKDKE